MVQPESSLANPSWRNQPLVDATPPRGLLAGTMFSLRALFKKKHLIYLLIQRDVKSRYKDSALGIVWSMFRPLVQLLIFYVAVGKFLGAERSIPEFAIFVFSGLTAWGLFYEILQGSTSSIVNNSGLIKKVYLPREIFPIAATGSAAFNFVVQFGVLAVATIVLGRAPLTWMFFSAVFGVLLLLIFGFALGLILSAVTVYFRDMQHFIEVILLVLFWASPIVYSYAFVSNFFQGNWIEQLYLANPITIGIMAFQRGMWIAGDATMWPSDLDTRLVIMTIASLFLVWFSQRIFARLEGNFAQEI